MLSGSLWVSEIIIRIVCYTDDIHELKPRLSWCFIELSRFGVDLFFNLFIHKFQKWTGHGFSDEGIPIEVLEKGVLENVLEAVGSYSLDRVSHQKFRDQINGFGTEVLREDWLVGDDEFLNLVEISILISEGCSTLHQLEEQNS